jgi:structural maintenance of chromosome 2
LRKRVNLKVDAMFEKTEKQYQELQRKKELTGENKKKFEETILELDNLKNQEIQKTWKKVDMFCGEIYSTLLPGAGAKLVPVKEHDASEGLELRVSFSGSWKDSLSELSGG